MAEVKVGAQWFCTLAKIAEKNQDSGGKPSTWLVMDVSGVSVLPSPGEKVTLSWDKPEAPTKRYLVTVTTAEEIKEVRIEGTITHIGIRELDS